MTVSDVADMILKVSRVFDVNFVNWALAIQDDSVFRGTSKCMNMHSPEKNLVVRWVFRGELSCNGSIGPEEVQSLRSFKYRGHPTVVGARCKKISF